MTVTRESLERLESHWAVVAIGEDRHRAIEVANARLVHSAVGQQLLIEFPETSDDIELLERASTAYEVAAIEGLDALLYPAVSEKSQNLREQAQAGAYSAFEIRRTLPLPEDVNEQIFHVLHLSALAYCGDRWSDLAAG